MQCQSLKSLLSEKMLYVCEILEEIIVMTRSFFLKLMFFLPSITMFS
jgi:hypothetical protein